MDGPDEEFGSVQDLGWYGLVLNVDEVEHLTDDRHFILSEDSQGFVDYESFESEDDARERFREIEQELYGEHPGLEDDF